MEAKTDVHANPTVKLDKIIWIAESLIETSYNEIISINSESKSYLQKLSSLFELQNFKQSLWVSPRAWMSTFGFGCFILELNTSLFHQRNYLGIIWQFSFWDQRDWERVIFEIF